MPIKTQSPRVYRTTYLPPDEDRKLAKRAQKEGISVAALIRQYIAQGLNNVRKG